MAININKYIDIFSGVGGASVTAQRELILRVFTPNTTPDAITEMTELSDVIKTFGSDSEEAKIASQYFGFISKMITKARKISFAYVNSAVSVWPKVLGTPLNASSGNYKTITDGTLKVVTNFGEAVLTNLDFSQELSWSAVATIIQTKLNEVVGFEDVTVVYDYSTTRNVINFTRFTDVVTDMEGDVATVMGWGPGREFIPGKEAQPVLDSIVEADEASDNYGTIAIIPEVGLPEWVSIASWNMAQNVKYMLLVPTTVSNYVLAYDALKSYSGVAITIDTNGERAEIIPGIITAAIDYSRRNSSQNFMYQQMAGFTATVTSNELATAIDATRVNYYGRTKTAGQSIEFYQNGYLCGDASAPTQMNVYANEMWLKSAITQKLLNMLRTLPILPATSEGRSMVLSGLQDIIEKALFNGTIQVGKTLSTEQKLYVNEASGDELAWHQIQNIGYWVDAKVTEEAQQNGTTKYIIDYVLLYSKADAVNKITGRDILI